VLLGAGTEGMGCDRPLFGYGPTNVRNLSGAPRRMNFGRALIFGGGALSIGPFEVTRLRSRGRVTYGDCFVSRYFLNSLCMCRSKGHVRCARSILQWNDLCGNASDE